MFEMKIYKQRFDQSFNFIPRQIFKYLTSRYEYDVDIDDYYGFVFEIPDGDVADVQRYLDDFGIELLYDPDNIGWYHLSNY